MSTAALNLPAAPATGLARSLSIFATETRYEFIRALRTRTFSLSVIGFPVMFYCLFGLMLNRNATVDGHQFAKIMLGSYAVFGVVGAALFGIGVGVAADLSAGWLELKRASPMPPLAYLLAKCCTAIAFGVIIVCILCLLGVTAGHVQLSLADFLRMVGLTIVGCIPFACMGLALGLIVPFNSAPGVTNLLYLPMSFLGGLWVPLSVLPDAISKLAPVFPTFHLGQLMLGILGQTAANPRGYANPAHSVLSHWIGLLSFTCIMLGIAAIAFNRREHNA
jgi:ABC-2 type transport system permease protein